MSIELLATKAAPGAVGPYSQGVKAGSMIFVSGQLPIVPETGELLKGEDRKSTRLNSSHL